MNLASQHPYVLSFALFLSQIHALNEISFQKNNTVYRFLLVETKKSALDDENYVPTDS